MQHVVQKRELNLTRVISAPRDLVWKAWTDPEILVRWFGAPPGQAGATKVNMDVRPGGKWSMTIIEPDGRQVPLFGTFREVTEPSHLVYTLESPDNVDNSKAEIISVNFVDRGAQTEVVFKQKGHMPEDVYLTSLKKVWTRFFDRLDKSVQTLSL